MPTTSSASADSRQMMKSALPNTALLRDDLALRRARMELVEERIFAGLQRVDDHRRLGARSEHLLDLERIALELHRRAAFVGYLDLDALAGGDIEIGRREHAVARDDLHRNDVVGGERDGRAEGNGEGAGEEGCSDAHFSSHLSCLCRQT